jgi:hypothetical protein
MANKKIICSLLIFITINAYSQDSTNKNTGIIYKKWPSWRMDGHKLNGKKLKAELYKVPAAIPYYKKSKTNVILAYSFSGAGLATILISSITRGVPPYNPNNQKTIKSIGTGLSIIGAITAIIYVSNLEKAIRIHNEKIVITY